MIKSVAKNLGILDIPSYDGAIKMKSFKLENIKSTAPKEFISLINKMIEKLPIKEGLAYFTIDGKNIVEGRSHRRPGLHIDGNFLPSKGWDSGGWKVGTDGKTLSAEDHLLCYESETGGMLIASDYSACRGWYV